MALSAHSLKLYKVLAVVALLLLFGLPITELWQTLGIFFFVLALSSASQLRNSTISISLLGGVVVIVTATIMLPQLKIQEGHNLYLPPDGGDLSGYPDLPEAVNTELREQFDRAYPADKRCDPKEYGCWRHFGRTPGTFAFSSDAVWQPGAVYSRLAHDIRFSSVADFNGGFLNNSGSSVLGSTNWYDYKSDVKRESMPFFVMYQLPAELQGSKICWMGELIWEVGQDRFEKIGSIGSSCRTVTASDIGKRVYGFNVGPEAGTRNMHLETSAALKFWNALRSILQVTGALLLLALFHFDKRRVLIMAALGGVAVAYLVTRPSWTSLAYYPVTVGGNDGLTHIGYGRYILYAFVHGQWDGALRGLEDVYYYMPGARYFWALSHAIFGDTNLGYLLLFIFLLVLIPLLIFRVAPAPLAVTLTGLFYLSSFLGNATWSVEPYFIEFKNSAAETLGYTFFVGALVALLPVRESNSSWQAKSVTGGLLLALAVFMRPNVLIGAGLLLMAIVLTVPSDHRKKMFLWLATGFSFAAFMPLHNLYFGQRLVLLTDAAGISVNLPTPPHVYWQAAQEAVMGSAGQAIRAVAEHWSLWLGKRPVVAALAVTSVVAALIFSKERNTRRVAAAALGLQVPLLFWTPYGRYAYLAWFLTFLVSVVIVGEMLMRVRPLLSRGEPRRRWKEWLST